MTDANRNAVRRLEKRKVLWGKNVPDDQSQPQRPETRAVEEHTLSFCYRCNCTCFYSMLND